MLRPPLNRWTWCTKTDSSCLIVIHNLAPLQQATTYCSLQGDPAAGLTATILIFVGPSFLPSMISVRYSFLCYPPVRSIHLHVSRNLLSVLGVSGTTLKDINCHMVRSITQLVIRHLRRRSPALLLLILLRPLVFRNCKLCRVSRSEVSTHSGTTQTDSKGFS